MSTIEQRLAVDDLLARYALCIDEDRLEEWASFFVEDCRYQITSYDNYRAGLPHCVMYADSRGMLQDRISAVRDASIFESQRYRHIVGSATVDEVDNELISTANFIVVRIMQDGVSDLFVSGQYRDRIDISGPSYLFKEKIAVIDSSRIDTLIAIPL